MISRATERKESSSGPVASPVAGSMAERGVEAPERARSGRPTCWRVAMTETGMVNIWASAPAMAPSSSSAAVESGGRAEPLGALRRRRAM